MKVLIVLYDGFTEYEYQIPLLAFHHFKIPFETVGLNHTEITGMIGLNISIPKTLDDIEPAGYSALFLPGLDRSTRDQVMQDEGLLSLILEFDQEKKLIAAVCGSTVLLGRAGILKSKRFCSDVQTHPVFENAIQVQDSAIRDRHVINGLGARIFHFTALLIEALVGKEQSIEYQRWAGLQAL